MIEANRTYVKVNQAELREKENQQRIEIIKEGVTGLLFVGSLLTLMVFLMLTLPLLAI